MTLEALTARLADELDIRLDGESPDGSIELVLDDDMVIEVHPDLSGPGFLFSATVCSLPAKDREAVFGELLHANLLGQGTQGARLGIDPGLDEIVLCRSFSDDDMPYEVFSEDLSRFAETLEFWRERDRHGKLGTGDPDEEPADEASTGREGPRADAIKV